ncbi:zinc finger, CCHC-type containing protein [Tanacetum coccineum]
MNKITTPCEICSGPHDSQNCMENPEQAFVEYASSYTNEVGGRWYTFKPEQNNLGDTYNPSWRSHPNLRTAKLHNDILMFQQHHGESLFEAWTRFKDLLQKVPHHSIDLWLQVQIFYDHVNPITRRTIDQSAGGKLRDLNPEESWEILEDLALYDNEIWNDPRDFAKPVKAIAC